MIDRCRISSLLSAILLCVCCACAFDDVTFLDFHGTKVLLVRGNDKLNKTGFQCPADGFYPVGECDPFYYVCLGGTVYPAICPGTGIFDPATSTCVDYSVSSCATTTAFTGSTAPGPIKCEADGFYAFGDCLQSFYFCADGVAYYEQCPSGLVFVESLQTCKTPAEAGCPETATTTTPTTTQMITSTTTTTTEVTSTTTSSSTTSSSTTPGTPIPGPCDNKPNGFYAYDHCQQHYYICSQGQQIDQVCPGGLFYDEVVGICTTEEDCLRFKCPNNEIGYYPISPGACSEFYFTCYQGEAFPQKCPDGVYFNELVHACDNSPNNPCSQNPVQQYVFKSDSLR